MYKCISVLVCVLLMLSLSSCNEAVVPNSQPVEQTTKPTPSTTAPTVPAKDINPLTGLFDIIPAQSVRPVCVMIGNDDRSRPQAGIDKADMYVEAETEGGITRIMAVFAGVARVPGKLGPIRSARTPFILIAESLGSVYCHAGGSRAGLNVLRTADVGNIDALYGINNSAFWRDAGLRNSKGLEYSMMTSGERLNTRIKAFRFSQKTNNPSPFAFGGSISGSSAENIQVKMSNLQTLSFRYDADSGLYTKINGTLSRGTAHKTIDGAILKATNIIIMYDNKYNEDGRTISFRLQNGTGLLVSGGKSRQIRWSRSKGSLVFTENDGSKLMLPTGKPYICLTDSSNSSKTVIT